jgi:hypothetical protein
MENAIQRTRRYWYDDGLTEIATGLVFMLIGAMFAVEAIGVLFSGLSSILLPIVVIGGFVIANRLVRVAKERITYPRTGFVAYPRAKKGWKSAAALIGGIMGASIAFFFLTAPVSDAWIPLFQGLFVGGAFLYFGYSIPLLRFYAIAVIALAAGIASFLIFAASGPGSAAFFTVVGLALAVAGALTLSRYLHNTKPSED